MKRFLFWALFSFQIAGYAFGENSDINYALCQTTEHLKSVLRERFPKNPKWELPENNYKDADSIIFSHLDKLHLKSGHIIHIELWDVMFKLNKDAYSCPYIEVGQGQKDYDYIKVSSKNQELENFRISNLLRMRIVENLRLLFNQFLELTLSMCSLKIFPNKVFGNGYYCTK